MVEAWQGAGGTDLNGDGDVSDRVPHLFDPRSGRVTNSAIAGLSHEIGRTGMTIFAVEAWEQSDLNDDGDTADVVLHVLQRELDD